MDTYESLKHQGLLFTSEDMDHYSYDFQSMDFLEREQIADDICELLKIFDKSTLNNGSVSIALDGKWGSGKTYFINMFINKIMKDYPADKVVYYDAWEHDDSESTLLPLLYAIMSKINDSTNEEYIDRIMDFFNIFTITVAKLGAVKVFGGSIDSVNEIITDAIDRMSPENKKTATEAVAIFNDYEKYYNRRGTLHNLLRSLVGDSNRLWVFIDDLDRCKPKFALETLEDIKHFFNIKNIVFIFSTDINQLSVTVKKSYGIDKEKESYIRKFFDYIYLFPSPDYTKYLKKLIEKKRLVFHDSEIIKHLVKLYNHFDFSLREVDQNIAHLQMFYESNSENISGALESRNINCFKVYLYFLVLRDKFPQLYNLIVKGKFTLKENSFGPWEFINDYYTFDSWTKHLLDIIQEGNVEINLNTIISEYRLFSNVVAPDLVGHMELVLR